MAKIESSAISFAWLEHAKPGDDISKELQFMDQLAKKAGVYPKEGYGVERSNWQRVRRAFRRIVVGW